MSSDRRNTNSRRNKDRRKSQDRRLDNDRRDIPERKKERSKGEKKQNSKKKPFMTRMFKAFAVVITTLVLSFTAVTVIFFGRLDYFMGKAANEVELKLVNASLDAKSLTGRTTKAKLLIQVKNKLPAGILLQDMRYNVNLGGYTVAKGIQLTPNFQVTPKSQKNLAVSFQVNSIMARRGLQKTIEQNARGILNSLLNRIQGKTAKLADNIKGIVKIKGRAEFRLIFAGIEIPFTKTIDFSGSS